MTALRSPLEKRRRGSATATAVRLLVLVLPCALLVSGCGRDCGNLAAARAAYARDSVAALGLDALLDALMARGEA